MLKRSLVCPHFNTVALAGGKENKVHASNVQ